MGNSFVFVNMARVGQCVLLIACYSLHALAIRVKTENRGNEVLSVGREEPEVRAPIAAFRDNIRDDTQNVEIPFAQMRIDAAGQLLTGVHAPRSPSGQLYFAMLTGRPDAVQGVQGMGFTQSEVIEAALTFEDRAKRDLRRGLYIKQFTIVQLLEAIYLPKVKDMLQMDQAQAAAALASDSCRQIFKEVAELFLDYSAFRGQLSAPEAPASAESIMERILTAVLET